MKRNNVILIGALTASAFIASAIAKKKSSEKAMNLNDEDIQTEECCNYEEKEELVKTKNKNKNAVKVNNSLISITIKLFSK